MCLSEEVLGKQESKPDSDVGAIINELQKAHQEATGERLALYMDDCIVAEAEVEDENAAIIARFFDDEGANARFYILAHNHLPALLSDYERVKEEVQQFKNYLNCDSIDEHKAAIDKIASEVLVEARSEVALQQEISSLTQTNERLQARIDELESLTQKDAFLGYELSKQIIELQEEKEDALRQLSYLREVFNNPKDPDDIPRAIQSLMQCLNDADKNTFNMLIRWARLLGKSEGEMENSGNNSPLLFVNLDTAKRIEELGEEVRALQSQNATLQMEHSKLNEAYEYECQRVRDLVQELRAIKTQHEENTALLNQWQKAQVCDKCGEATNETYLLLNQSFIGMYQSHSASQVEYRAKLIAENTQLKQQLSEAKREMEEFAKLVFDQNNVGLENGWSRGLHKLSYVLLDELTRFGYLEKHPERDWFRWKEDKEVFNG